MYFMLKKINVLLVELIKGDQVFQECNNSSASQLGMIRRRFQEAIDDSGRKLSRCVRKLSDDGEKLVQRGADVTCQRQAPA